MRFSLVTGLGFSACEKGTVLQGRPNSLRKTPVWKGTNSQPEEAPQFCRGTASLLAEEPPILQGPTSQPAQELPVLKGTASPGAKETPF
jgi:hypothetical protein